MPGWREETGVATRIAWGERGANDGRTGLVSGLCYLLDVIDGEQRGKRRRAGSSFSACTCILLYCLQEITYISIPWHDLLWYGLPWHFFVTKCLLSYESQQTLTELNWTMNTTIHIKIIKVDNKAVVYYDQVLHYEIRYFGVKEKYTNAFSISSL